MPSEPSLPPEPPIPQDDGKPTLWQRVRLLIVGPPRNLGDKSVFHTMALIPILAWVGLGADGLSSSAYGPEETFKTLKEHTYIAVALAAMTMLTVFIISYAYSRLIEEFPSGGGGYVVATKILGPSAGVVSGSALLVDYVLTITVSIAAAGDALFSFLPDSWQACWLRHLEGGGTAPLFAYLPESWQNWKFVSEVAFIVYLTALNLRGVKESVLTLTPVFMLFVVTHVVLIVAGIAMKAPQLGATAHAVRDSYHHGLSSIGMAGMLLLFVRAYSLGGGTYTGIEAVSNGLPIMREPRVHNARITMLYMATSLALTASGLILCYLLWGVSPVEGKTMNAVLVGGFVQKLPHYGLHLGYVFVILTLFSEGALLVVAGQAGFVDGPRILANMAVDSWMPRRFAGLSERLTTQNGVLLMGLTSLLALFYTAGNVDQIVVMYSINVFLTFSMTETSMCRFWFSSRAKRPDWSRKIVVHMIGLTLCLTILVVTVIEKFTVGGWITLAVTGLVITLCFLIRRHYRNVTQALTQLYQVLHDAQRPPLENIPPFDANQPTAGVLVAAYGGLGIHTVLQIFRMFPGHFKNLVFLSVGVADSGLFKGEESIDDLRAHTEETLKKYVELARGLGIPAQYRLAIGTDPVEEGEKLCTAASSEFPRMTFFAGYVIFGRERWYHRLLHNETAFAIQRRLQWSGKPVVVLPARLA